MKIIAGLGNIGKEYDKTRHYMNLSGNAVGPWAHFYNIAPEDVAVVHDDMDLPLGTIRIRKNGSSGGHNGIKSIISNLGTDAFPRFRLGIGHPVHEQQAVISHVLQPFAGDDKQLIEEAVKKMADALELWLKEDGDLAKVMQQFNTKKKSKTTTCAPEKSVIL